MVLLCVVCVKSVSENIGPNSPKSYGKKLRLLRVNMSDWCLVYWLYASINNNYMYVYVHMVLHPIEKAVAVCIILGKLDITCSY